MLKVAAISLGLLILLIAATIGAFMYFGPTLAAKDSGSVSGTNPDDSDIVRVERALWDSLTNEVDHYVVEMIGGSSILDSLTDVVHQKDGELAVLTQNVADLQAQLQSLNLTANNVRELAKTYESMKPEEIGPILSAVNDETVITLYQSMSARAKKNIFTALTTERAAQLTELLAKPVEN